MGTRRSRTERAGGREKREVRFVSNGVTVVGFAVVDGERSRFRLYLHTYVDVNPEAVVRTAAISTTENSTRNKDGRCLRT